MCNNLDLIVIKYVTTEVINYLGYFTLDFKCLNAFFWVIPRPLNFVCQRFGVTHFPYKYPNILNPNHSSYPSAHEDGTDRVFRNVGIQTSDARKLPRRKHTTRIQALFLCYKFTVFTYVRKPNKLGLFKFLKATWLMI